MKTVGEQRLIAAHSIESDQDLGSYLISHAYRITGPVDIERLKSCLDRLVHQIPVLCAVFDEHPIVARRMTIVEKPEYFIDHGEIDCSDDKIVEFCQQCAARPTDYRRGPLFRADLARCSDAHVLVLAWDHTIADAWSVSLCQTWLSDLYSGVGGAIPLDSTNWPVFVEHELDGIRATAEPGRFWVDQVEHAKPAELPGRRVGDLSQRAVSLRVPLAGDEFTKHCAEVGATRSAVALCAAFGACGAFHMNSGGPNVLVLPTMLSNRDDQFHNTVGLLMRSVLIRLAVKDEVATTVAEIRQLIMAQLGAAYAHRHESIAYVFERYRASLENFSELPLPLFVQLVDVPARELALPGCESEAVYHSFERSCRFAAEVHLRPIANGGLEALVIYDSTVYQAEDIDAATAALIRWIAVFTDPSLSGVEVYALGSQTS